MLSQILFLDIVSVLKQCRLTGDLQPYSTLQLALDKLPQVLDEKLWFYVRLVLICLCLKNGFKNVILRKEEYRLIEAKVLQ